MRARHPQRAEQLPAAVRPLVAPRPPWPPPPAPLPTPSPALAVRGDAAVAVAVRNRGGARAHHRAGATPTACAALRGPIAGLAARASLPYSGGMKLRRGKTRFRGRASSTLSSLSNATHTR